jgi:hypothetical protein
MMRLDLEHGLGRRQRCCRDVSRDITTRRPVRPDVKANKEAAILHSGRHLIGVVDGVFCCIIVMGSIRGRVFQPS